MEQCAFQRTHSSDVDPPLNGTTKTISQVAHRVLDDEEYTSPDINFPTYIGLPNVIKGLSKAG